MPSLLFVNALLFQEDGTYRPGSLRVQDGFIREIGELSPLSGETVLDCRGDKLLPGLVDIHTHGRAGGDFSGGSLEELESMALSYASRGVTSLLATTMTLPLGPLEQAYKALGDFLSRPHPGSRVLGVNMEGPFLCGEKRGAHDQDFLLPPDYALFEKLNALSKGHIRICCVAPELPGALNFISQVSRVCTVSLAHTAGSYEAVLSGIHAGARGVTHLYNAMSPFSHREPGAVGAAFDTDVYGELICDGVHVHPAAIRAAFRQKPGRVCIISDSMRAAGMPEGIYSLGGQEVTVRDGKALLADGTIAGSVSDVGRELRFCVEHGVPEGEAVLAATAVPAKLIGVYSHLGSLSPGKYADLCLADKMLRIKRVFVGGEEMTQ